MFGKDDEYVGELDLGAKPRSSTEGQKPNFWEQDAVISNPASSGDSHILTQLAGSLLGGLSLNLTDYVPALKKGHKDFERNHPYYNMLTELAGALATLPIGAGALAGKGAMLGGKLGLNALKATKGVDAANSGLKGAALTDEALKATQLANEAKKASLTKRLLAGAGAGSAYGGISSFNHADTGERLESGLGGAAGGALIGAALPVTLSGIRHAGKAVKDFMSTSDTNGLFDRLATAIANNRAGSRLNNILKGKDINEIQQAIPAGGMVFHGDNGLLGQAALLAAKGAPEDRNVLKAIIESDRAKAPSRVLDIIEEAMPSKGSNNPYSLLEKMNEHKVLSAEANYDKVKGTFSLHPKVRDAILASPNSQRFFKKAEGYPSIGVGDDVSIGLKDIANLPDEGARFSLPSMRYIKSHFESEIDKLLSLERTKGATKTERAGLEALKSKLISDLRHQSPALAYADDAFARDSNRINSLKEGMAFNFKPKTGLEELEVKMSQHPYPELAEKGEFEKNLRLFGKGLPVAFKNLYRSLPQKDTELVSKMATKLKPKNTREILDAALAPGKSKEFLANLSAEEARTAKNAVLHNFIKTAETGDVGTLVNSSDALTHALLKVTGLGGGLHQKAFMINSLKKLLNPVEKRILRALLKPLTSDNVAELNSMLKVYKKSADRNTKFYNFSKTLARSASVVAGTAAAKENPSYN